MDKSIFDQHLFKLKTVIQEAEQTSSRAPKSVKLLAVTKGVSTRFINYAIAAGLKDFGENYLQEAQLKIKELSNKAVNWHFIGPIQSNKCKDIANYFSWVHSVSRLKIAVILNNERPLTLPALNICIQVNIDDEKSKSGVLPHELAPLVESILKLPRLHLRGLMMIPKPVEDEHLQYQSFLRLKHLLEHINNQFDLTLDTLSMGMSDDLKPAIKAGSTIVRIGRALFGERTK